MRDFDFGIFQSMLANLFHYDIDFINELNIAKWTEMLMSKASGLVNKSNMIYKEKNISEKKFFN